MGTSTLAGARILVVEDEPLISMMAEDMLEEMGCVVAGTARDTRGTLSLAQSQLPDCVLLDVHLADGDSYGLADALLSEGIPVIFSTGDTRADMPRSYDGHPCLSKPFTFEQLRSGLERALRLHA